jgi:hypothetical protein
MLDLSSMIIAFGLASLGIAAALHFIALKYDDVESIPNDDLVFRLRKRAEIRRQIQSRKSVQEGKPDRIADLLEEAADRIEILEELI